MSIGARPRHIAESLAVDKGNDARWRTFYESAAAVGLYPEGMAYRRAYTLQFVDKKVGMTAGK
ncbi:MAG TPA: hypothetical protein VMF86_09060 [Stellaceae bacterium]|nr:hypothetical protein [Stellaceae bacterium]